MLPVLAGFNPSWLNGIYCDGETIHAGLGQISGKRRKQQDGGDVQLRFREERTRRGGEYIGPRASFFTIPYTAQQIIGCWVVWRLRTRIYN